MKQIRLQPAQLFLLAITWAIEVAAASGQLRPGDSAGFRLPDDRPILTPADVESAGLHVVESRHLRLITDIPLESVRDLPALADELFGVLQKRLGPLRPAKDGSDFQVTGFLMENRERFRNAELLPEQDFVIRHGRHLGYRFWMNNQVSDYYRRHLMLHEFVHCYMMCEFGMKEIPPLWYTEGIAEYFATHKGPPTAFGILPEQTGGFEGWGRITELHTQASNSETQHLCVLDQILHPTDQNFTSDLRYAQAWAMYWLLQTHPELQPHAEKFSLVRTGTDFSDAWKTIPADIQNRLPVAWLLTTDSLVEGFETDLSFCELNPKSNHWKSGQTAQTIKLDARREWQSSGLSFDEDTTIRITATGRYSVHDQPRPWISEPQGITIRYHRGRPLGEVTAMFVPKDGSHIAPRIPVGADKSLTAPAGTELWLQINDSAASRADNQGSVDVKIED